MTNLTQLSPASLVEGAAGQVKLAGANFRPTHQVLINGKKIESRFVSGRELELQVPSLKAGTHKITVIDPGIPTSESSARLSGGVIQVDWRWQANMNNFSVRAL